MYANRRVVTNAATVEKTNKIISNLEALISAVKDAETGFRGYVLTQNTNFLEPYIGSRRTVDSLYLQTAKLYEESPEQLVHLNQLKKKLDAKFKGISDNLSIIQQTGTNNLLPDSIINTRALMIRIRKDVSTMQDHEKILLIQRSKELENTSTAVTSIMIAAIIIAFFSVVFGFSTHRKENKERMEAEQKVKTYQAELEQRVKDLAEANIKLQQLKKQEKFASSGRIARTIAHEIRNPLTNINLATHQLETEVLPNDEDGKFYFEIIMRNSERINHLISDLLNSTKFSDLHYESLTINELLDETVQEANDRLLLNGVELVKMFTPEICKFQGDKGKLHIAFLNIILNAAEALEHTVKGVITLETRREENLCKVIIKDNGPGMDEETLDKLFEPYFTNKPNGNGLGLTNTQNIILNHKGDIEVRSLPGQGTFFTVSLPLEEKQ